MEIDFRRLETIINDIFLFIDEKRPVSFNEDVFEIIFKSANKQFALTARDKNSKNIFIELLNGHMTRYTQEKVSLAMKLALSNPDPFETMRVICKYSFSIRRVSKILQGLFHRFMTFESSKRSVFEIVYNEWYTLVLLPYSKIISNCFCQIIENHRNGYVIDKNQLKQLVDTIVEIDEVLKKDFQMYSDIIEVPLQIFTCTFFQTKHVQLFYSSYLPDYITTVYKIIQEEKRMLNDFFHIRSEKTILNIVYNELISNKLTDILNFYKNILTDSTSASYLFEILSYREDDLKLFSNLFTNCIKSRGLEIIDVNDTVKFFHTVNNMIRNIFKNNHLFLKSLKDGFEFILNRDISTAKILALNLHKVLLKTCILPDSEKQIIRTNIMFLYRYLVNKDVFEVEYHKHLALRLLENTSSNDVEEKEIIDLFKTISGSSATSKFESMFQDISISKSLVEKFKNKTDIEFDAMICRLGCWPNRSNTEIPIPKELTNLAKDFKDFYKNQYPDRSLQFDMNFGQSELNITIDNTTKIVLVSSIQMVLLLEISKSQTPKTIKELMDSTKLSFVEIVDHLMSLVHPDYSILQKKPSTRDLKEDHMVRMSPKWSSKVVNMKRFKVLLSSFDDIKQQPQTTNLIDKDIQMNRIFLIESSIVRAMKIKKKLNYNELFFEIQNQLKNRFEVIPNVVRSCIDHLIEQDYMERDENDRSTFLYIA